MWCLYGSSQCPEQGTHPATQVCRKTLVESSRWPVRPWCSDPAGRVWLFQQFHRGRASDIPHVKGSHKGAQGNFCKTWDSRCASNRQWPPVSLSGILSFRVNLVFWSCDVITSVSTVKLWILRWSPGGSWEHAPGPPWNPPGLRSLELTSPPNEKS